MPTLPLSLTLSAGFIGSDPSLRILRAGAPALPTTMSLAPGARFMVVGEDGAPTLNVIHDGANPMNPAIRVNDNGRVGVGTTSPGARLMVVGEAGAPTLNVLHDGSNPMNPALRINDNGRVGIGTTAPRARVEIADGDVYLPNANNGIIMTAPTGVCYRVTVNNFGQLESNEVTCPN